MAVIIDEPLLFKRPSVTAEQILPIAAPNSHLAIQLFLNVFSIFIP
jgi:hypothetical protein